ncbi:MAG: hypothetical protein QXM16_06390 [Nitrososphaerota archaeon]
MLIPPIACGLHAGQTFVINDIDGRYVTIAHGILSELLRLTNHSSYVHAFAEKAAELGLPTRGGVANAVVFSPPYCNLISSPRLRGFAKYNEARTPFTKGNYRAFIHQLIASSYTMLRLFGWCVVVVKHATTTSKTQIPEVVVEAMRAVGFKNIEKHVFQLAKQSAYAEYHKARGHEHEHLQYEYVIAGQKLGSAKPEVKQP